jgi:hypothetical protein
LGFSSNIKPMIGDGPPLLDATKIWQALGMWRKGRDTHRIAHLLREPEAAVYNSLARVRDNKRLLP